MFAVPPGERVENGKLGHQSPQVGTRLHSQNTLLVTRSQTSMRNIEMRPDLSWTTLQWRKGPLPLLLLLLLLPGALAPPVSPPSCLRLESQHVLDVEVSLLHQLLHGEELSQPGLVLLYEMIGIEVMDAVIPVAVQSGVSLVPGHPTGDVNYEALEMLRVSSLDSSITTKQIDRNTKFDTQKVRTICL